MSVRECQELAVKYFGSPDVAIRYREERDLSESKDRLLAMRVWALAFHHAPGNPTGSVGTAFRAVSPVSFACNPPAVLGVGMHIRKELEPKALERLAEALRIELAQVAAQSA
jgi:hypothetical protein